MSIAPVGSNHSWQAYFQERNADLKKLGQDLKAGDLAAAQQDFTTIQNLAKDGPLPNGEAFVAPPIGRAPSPVPPIKPAPSPVPPIKPAPSPMPPIGSPTGGANAVNETA